MRAEKKPLVSAIVAVRNGERFLAQAIQSILDQSYWPYEIIVIDDGSTDRTRDIARSYTPVRYFYQKHQGVSVARNRGIEEAKGEYIAFLDDDGLWTRDKLEAQVGRMIDDPGLQYTVAHVKCFVEPGLPIPHGMKKELLEGTQVGYIPETLVARKTLFQRIGMFDAQLRTAEDVDWFARARDQRIAAAALPNVLLHKRYHDKNISMNIDLNNQNLLDVLQRSILRRREGEKDSS